MNLCSEWRTFVLTFKKVPHALTAPLRRGLKLALEKLHKATANGTALDDPAVMRAWKLLQLVPRLLLHRRPGGHKYEKHELEERVRFFDAGEWATLYNNALQTARGTRPGRELSDEERETALYERACQLVQDGEVSHARQTLVGMSFAPGDKETFRQLQDKDARPRTPTEALPEELRDFVPPTSVQLDKSLLLNTLRGLRKGLSGGLSGMRNEHLKVLLPDTEALDYLITAATLLINARLSPEALAPFKLTRMSAFQKSGA